MFGSEVAIHQSLMESPYRTLNPHVCILIYLQNSLTHCGDIRIASTIVLCTSIRIMLFNNKATSRKIIKIGPSSMAKKYNSECY
jgi:hypothetical protein